MSQANAALGVAVSPAPGRSSRAFKTGAIVMLGCFIIFSSAVLLLPEQGGVLPAAVSPAAAQNTAYMVGGQWVAMALADLVRAMPGTIPGVAHFLMPALAALLLGWLSAILIRRGWTPCETALAAGLIALNPVALLMATSDGAMLLAVIAAGAAVLALDRIEAIGDTQATIVFGMAFAFMFALWPDALYFGGILLVALPVANREVRSASSAAAAFFIACAPAGILLASFLLGANWFGVSIVQMITVWQAPLHGGAISAVASSAWLGRFGGQFWPAWGATLCLCLTVTPPMLVIPLRFIMRQARARPITGAVACFAPALAGAFMTLFWHIASPAMPVALSLGIVSVWAVTVQLRGYERRIWIALALLGTIIGWTTPFLWQTAATQAWRSAIIGATNN